LDRSLSACSNKFSVFSQRNNHPKAPEKIRTWQQQMSCITLPIHSILLGSSLFFDVVAEKVNISLIWRSKKL